MNERITQYRDRMLGYWNQFGKKQKTFIIATVTFALLAIILLTIQFSKTEYDVAFTGLDSTDAAGIINYLESSGVPYKLGPDGSTISVPSKEAARVKVDVGSQGIVQSGSIGLDAFNESSSLIGMTDNEFNVKYKTAINGEVEKLLKRMQGINDAKVLLNLPAENVFASPEDQEKASASIVLSFKPGYRPNQEAIDGYFNLVKTSVPNLPVENISLSSSDDTVLLPSGQGGATGSLTTAVQENMALQKKFESDVRQSVKQFLSRLTGPDKIEVLVASKLNFDQVSQKDNLVTPVDTENMKGIEISAQKVQKSYTGAASPTSGVPGTGQEDVVNYPSAETSGGSSSEESSSTINYEVNRITKDIIASPYVIKDLTINVAVEPPVGQDTLDENTQSAIENILKNIVGSYLADSGTTYTDEELQKKVSVLSQPFHSDATQTSGLSLSSPLVWGVGGAALLALAGLGIVLFRRRKKATEAEEDLALPLTPEFPSINLDTVTNENQVRKQLETLAKKKPDEFVNLLRTWLADE
ncbi:Flagellar M-ring protein [compost metagenome]|uniref:Flagellar M-ring protein n=2 Tax=Paenibacillus TaxID=44249 RepID=A0ABS2HER0_9BACL|nr:MULTISPECIES: flagellar basal-body MS-ring/collar protein FliF [Paenibacillus]MBM6998370.1 flagellar M-ring protein FliF [Paenibacillus rhizolycopersici]MCH1640574.1 flagellar M-ring protein FliF [Paenibacillus timonensis]MDU2241816.1 flagellar basal-body MS-ring/collar protein FliF [Paenibacillus sp.]MUG87627.1 flagellar M-ring protein FliF [Paenibacillus timonensis]GIP46673.1 flagellar M-ring protein [Paenibacillus sp. J53TS2]